MKPKITITRFVLLTSLAIAATLSAGCDLQIAGSGGRSSSSESDPEQQLGAFRLQFQNSLIFSNDLSGSVDNLFARMESGDANAENFLRSFLRPGYDVIYQNLGIRLKDPIVSFSPENQSILFQSEWSSWTDLVNPSMVEHTDNANARWRAQLYSSEIGYSSYSPNQLAFDVRLEVEVQVLNGDTWAPMTLKSTSVNSLSEQVGKSVVAAYNTYLEQNFGADLSSPQFRSQDGQ